MTRQIKVKAGSVIAVAELYNTKTAEAIWQALPFNSKVNTWGDEIYFRIPVKIELEAGQEIVNSGDLGYWPPGSAFCIFFGQTQQLDSKAARWIASDTIRELESEAVQRRLKR